MSCNAGGKPDLTGGAGHRLSLQRPQSCRRVVSNTHFQSPHLHRNRLSLGRKRKKVVSFFLCLAERERERERVEKGGKGTPLTFLE